MDIRIYCERKRRNNEPIWFLPLRFRGLSIFLFIPICGDKDYPNREHSLLYKGKDHVLSTSQKAGLTGLYKKFLFMSTTAISKLFFQEVDGTVILPPTFIKE